MQMNKEADKDNMRKLVQCLTSWVGRKERHLSLCSDIAVMQLSGPKILDFYRYLSLAVFRLFLYVVFVLHGLSFGHCFFSWFSDFVLRGLEFWTFCFFNWYLQYV